MLALSFLPAPSGNTVFIGTGGGNEELARKECDIRRRLCDIGIPAYPSVRRAVRALCHLSRYHAARGASNT
jgi:hypothetical protein